MSFLNKGVSGKIPRKLQAGSWEGRKASSSCKSCWNSCFTAGESLRPDSGGSLSFLPHWGVSLTCSGSTLPLQSTLFSGSRGSIQTRSQGFCNSFHWSYEPGPSTMWCLWSDPFFLRFFLFLTWYMCFVQHPANLDAFSMAHASTNMGIT